MLAEPAAAVLAGGLSARLGHEKALSQFGGTTVLEWQCTRLSRLFQHVFVVARDPARLSWLGVPVVADALRTPSSATGIFTAVLASPTEQLLCLACDMPFVSDALLLSLAANCKEYDAYVPRHGGYLEPLCAVYGRRVIEPLQMQLTRGVRRIDALYEDVRTGFLDVDDAFGAPAELFLNINTPEDLTRARARAGSVLDFGVASKVAAFVRRVPLPVISFVGKKKSGKTTVVEEVIGHLTSRGHRVAALKHHTHELNVDAPNTDSYRLRQAGAVVAALCAQREYFYVARSVRELSLEEHVLRLPEPVDLVVTEGFKLQDAPKIEVCRGGDSAELVCRPDELLALVSDEEVPGLSAPCFAPGDTEALALFVERWMREDWPRLHLSADGSTGVPEAEGAGS